MLVGLVYDLRKDYLALGFTEEQTAEFDSEDTIEHLDRTITSLGHRTDRIGNIRNLTARLVNGDRWDMVFNIAEGMYGRAREAQVPAILDAFNIPYTFSDPLVQALTLDKSMTKMIVMHAGLGTPKHWVINSTRGLNNMTEEMFEEHYPLLIKPLREGTGKGIWEDSVVGNFNDLKRAVLRCLDRFQQPALVEGYLPGREYTVGIIGNRSGARVVGALEIVLQAGSDKGVYSYRNKEECESLVRYVPVREPAKLKELSILALKSYRALGLSDAGRVDIRENAKKKPEFIEINALPGLNPTHSDLPMICTAFGITYKALIKMILDSAQSRREETFSPIMNAVSLC